MSRNPFGWDLPPGCTQRHIDEAAGALSFWQCPACGADNPVDNWYCSCCHTEPTEEDREFGTTIIETEDQDD